MPETTHASTQDAIGLETHTASFGALCIKRIPLSAIKAAEYNPRRELKPGMPEYENLKASIACDLVMQAMPFEGTSKKRTRYHSRVKRLKGHFCSFGDIWMELKSIPIADSGKKAEFLSNYA